MNHELSNTYHWYYYVAGPAACHGQSKSDMELAMRKLEALHERLIRERNVRRKRWELELDQVRQFGITNNGMTVEQAVSSYTEKLRQEEEEFLKLSRVHMNLSHKLRSSIDAFNKKEAAAGNANLHDSHMTDYEQGDTSESATTVAIIKPHVGQLRGNEKRGRSISATEAVIVNPHDASLRGSEQRGPECNTPHEDEAAQKKRKMDSSQVMPDNDPYDNA